MNPPVVFSTDPHLLAQWRFDERRRRNGSEDAALHRVSMVLGRFADRVEIRNPAEAPDVVASARAIAAETDKPVYRAALLEMADRIAVRFRTEQAPPDEPARPADDWLATLDARIAEAPSSPSEPAAESPSAPDAGAAPDAGLPDFLAADGWDAPVASSPGDTDPDEASAEGDADLPLLPLDPPAAESVDDALYIPPPIRGEDPPRDDGLDFLPSADDVLPRDEPAFEPWATPAPQFVTPDEDDFLMPGADEPADPLLADEPAASEAAPASGSPDEPAPSGAAEGVARTPHAAVPVFAVVTPPAEAPSGSAGADAPPLSAVDDRAEAAARLAELGRALGLAVSGRSVPAEEGALPGDRDPLAALDVVWRDGDEVAAAFLIDPPAPVVAALVDLADVVTEVTATPPLFLVGPEPLRAEARREAARPVFSRLPVPLADACGFIPYASLDDALRRAAGFLPYLRPGFIRAVAERLDG